MSAWRRPLTPEDTRVRDVLPDSTRPDVMLPESPPCAVCAEKANGRYFGAIVCLPCKSFFIRCTKDGKPTLSCPENMACDITGVNRMRCQYCRYKKCLSVGMSRKEKPETVQPGDGQDLCRVCLDIANGIHFGVTTCEGCKKFFRRALKEYPTYDCKFLKRCFINPRNRNSCRYCRYKKCLGVGMSREAIRMGRPKKSKPEDGRQAPSPVYPYAAPRPSTALYHGPYSAVDAFNFPQPPYDCKEPLLGFNDLMYGYKEPRCGFTDQTSDDDSGFSSGASDRSTPTASSLRMTTLLAATANIKREHISNLDFHAGAVPNRYPCGGPYNQPPFNHGLQTRPLVGAMNPPPLPLPPVDHRPPSHPLGVTLETPPAIDVDEVNDILASIGQQMGTMAPAQDSTKHVSNDATLNVRGNESCSVEHGYMSHAGIVKTEGASGSHLVNNGGANWNGYNDGACGVMASAAKNCQPLNYYQNYYNFCPSDNYQQVFT